MSTVCGAPARDRPGPQITHKVIEMLSCTILCLDLRCARAGRARPTSHTTSQRSGVMYHTCLRFAVRPRVPGPAQKSHNKSTHSNYLLYVLSVRGAPARAGPVGPPPPYRPGTRTHKQGIDRVSIGYRLKYHVSWCPSGGRGPSRSHTPRRSRRHGLNGTKSCTWMILLPW